MTPIKYPCRGPATIGPQGCGLCLLARQFAISCSDKPCILACSNQSVCNSTCSTIMPLPWPVRAGHDMVPPACWVCSLSAHQDGGKNLHIAGVSQCEQDLCSKAEEEKFECQLTDGEIRAHRDDEADAKEEPRSCQMPGVEATAVVAAPSYQVEKVLSVHGWGVRN